MAKTLAQKGLYQPDIAEVLLLVRDGKTYRELAKLYGVGASTIMDWLRATPEISVQSARAMADSAEAWLDRGLEAVTDTEDPSRGRNIAHECARRAGIRNMHYRERMGIDAKVDGNITIEIVKFGHADTDTEPVGS